MSANQYPRGRLAAKALVRLAAGFVFLSALLLLPAGTFAYWEALVYMTMLLLAIVLVFAYVLAKDPGLLERRMRMKEKDATQRRIIRVGALVYVCMYVIPGLDHRFGLSNVPVAAVIAADLIVLLGYGLFVLVLMENSYASRVVEVVPGQRVVTTGPYKLIRHPMYLGVLIMYTFTPVALGSWWAMVTVLPLIAVLVARIQSEERLLLRELDGYRQYSEVTRYRLIPGVW